jgi:hypothetical protein
VAVQAIKTEDRCKLCRHDRRVEIDELLEKRSLRKKTDDGAPINLAYVLAQLAEWGVDNPNEDNVKIHWRKHCRQVSDEKAAAELAEREDLIQKILDGEIPLADIDESMRLMFTLGVEEIKGRAARGERTGITIDHLVKFADTLTKRRHNEKTEQLMSALGGAVALAFGGAATGELPPAPDEIAGELIEEGELV